MTLRRLPSCYTTAKTPATPALFVRHVGLAFLPRGWKPLRYQLRGARSFLPRWKESFAAAQPLSRLPTTRQTHCTCLSTPSLLALQTNMSHNNSSSRTLLDTMMMSTWTLHLLPDHSPYPRRRLLFNGRRSSRDRLSTLCRPARHSPSSSITALPPIRVKRPRPRLVSPTPHSPLISGRPQSGIVLSCNTTLLRSRILLSTSLVFVSGHKDTIVYIPVLFSRAHRRAAGTATMSA